MTGILLAIAALSAAETRAKQAVICAETAFSRAAEYRDKALFLSFVDPDARFVSGQVARGRAEVGETWAIFFETDGPQIRWRPRVVAVSSDGRLALSRGPYRTVSTDVNGKRIESWEPSFPRGGSARMGNGRAVRYWSQCWDDARR